MAQSRAGKPTKANRSKRSTRALDTRSRDDRRSEPSSRQVSEKGGGGDNGHGDRAPVESGGKQQKNPMAAVNGAVEALGSAMAAWRDHTLKAAGETAAEGARTMSEVMSSAMRGHQDMIDSGRMQTLRALRQELTALQAMLDDLEHAGRREQPQESGRDNEVQSGDDRREHASDERETARNSPSSMGNMAMSGFQLWSDAAATYQRMWMSAARAMISSMPGPMPDRERPDQASRG